MIADIFRKGYQQGFKNEFFFPLHSYRGSEVGACRLQHCLVRAGVCICGISFLTGSSNNDSFPVVFSFDSFCARPCYFRPDSRGFVAGINAYVHLFVLEAMLALRREL